MGHKIFVSYKYGDTDVYPVRRGGIVCPKPFSQDYVTEISNLIADYDMGVYKGERDGEDLSMLSEDTIARKLHDKIYDSSITIVLISPNMRVFGKLQNNQWIPREVSYSLKEITRDGKTSHRNALLCIVLPDRSGHYDYVRSMSHFDIIRHNTNNGYANMVNWDDFRCNPKRYIDDAFQRKSRVPERDIVKQI